MNYCHYSGIIEYTRSIKLIVIGAHMVAELAKVPQIVKQSLTVTIFNLTPQNKSRSKDQSFCFKYCWNGYTAKLAKKSEITIRE